jgi:hypothetical protein
MQRGRPNPDSGPADRGLTGSMAESIARLRAHGIWLGAQVQTFALEEEAKLTR